MRVVAGAVLLAACTAPAGAASVESPPPGDHRFAITVDGVERRYVVHVPKCSDSASGMPAVLMFHGGGGQARAAMWETGWADVADAECFLAAFPEGTARDQSRPASFVGNPQTWNDGSLRSSLGAVQQRVKDVEFVSAMLEDLAARCNVDRHRIYATGFSNGASMSFRLARELSCRFAAIAPVAGVDWMAAKRPDRAVPLLYITGTSDPLNPFEGGDIRIGRNRYGTKPATSEMIAGWLAIHGCREDGAVAIQRDGALGMVYRGADGSEAVVVYSLPGHGHHWPGGRSALPPSFAGPNASAFPATDVIWEFFRGHALPEECDPHPPERP